MTAVDVGLDMGATLAKLVVVRQNSPLTSFVPFLAEAGDRAAIETVLAANRVRTLAVTGGGASRLAAWLGADRLTHHADEFEAWASGEALIVERAGLALSFPRLLVSLGTGTSILALERPGSARRVGGTALGGGTLRGLGGALVNESDHARLVALAARGDRRRVDLVVGDIYPPGEIALMPDLTASNFGKAALHDGGSRHEPSHLEDLAAAIVGLVGENIALLAGAHARSLAHGSRLDVVYAGSTLRGNEPLKTVLRDVTALVGEVAHFPKDAEFAGALGALALSRSDGRGPD